MDDSGGGLPIGAVATAVATAFATGAGVIRWLAVGRIEDLKSQITQQRSDLERLGKQCESLHQSHSECERRCAEMSARIAVLENP